jgi:thiamine-phosphate pyrophosphorylase
MTLARVYPVVDSAEWVGRLLPLGVRLIQLRIKTGSAGEIRSEIRKAKELCSRADAQLVVNDHWSLAMAEGCDFVHLGQGDLDTADVSALRKAGIRIGISTHDDTELARALTLQPDYVALGPIYHTSLKVMPWSPQGLERIAEWKRRVGQIPLVAIGGLTVERLPGVFDAGADIAAVVSDIVQDRDPAKRTREWLVTAARCTSRWTSGQP